MYVAATGAEAESLYGAVPTKSAVSECTPAPSTLVVKSATTPPTTGSEPSTVAPLLKLTVPLAAPDEATTVALNVTAEYAAPETGVTPSVVTVVRAATAVTTTETGADVEAACEPPRYRAVTALVPTGRATVDSVATPAVTVAVPSDVAPARNSTSPVAAAGSTVAVRSTDVPASTAVAETPSVVVLGSEGNAAAGIDQVRFALEVPVIVRPVSKYAIELPSTSRHATRNGSDRGVAGLRRQVRQRLRLAHEVAAARVRAAVGVDQRGDGAERAPAPSR